MRVLIQGAGAIAAAAGALFAEAGAAVTAASRRDGVTLTAVRRRSGTTVDVPVTVYAGIAPGVFDLLVLTSAPGELAPEVAAVLRDARIPAVVGTSQVPGDLAPTRALFPHAEVGWLAPNVASFATSRGPQTRAEFWVPPLLGAFLVAGDGALPARMAAEFPRVVRRAPMRAVEASPAGLVPYAAELAVVDGDWDAFRRSLGRPGAAAAEALRVVTGRTAPALPPIVVRVGLATAGVAIPFDVPTFAGNHFVRHAEQSLRMLDAWRAAAGRPTPALDSLRTDLAAAIDRRT
ncbi:hypothetical protein GCM10009551_103400 [Nocardiopsis tropica]